ncbi:MAG TPA: hypothetical protein PKC29_06180 [Thermodesulfobacteriota bacterium]|nr:hypothetical protein [Thermodesulfobacteriota bacterium]
MSKLAIIVLALAAALLCCTRMAAAAPPAGSQNQSSQEGTAEPFLLGLPEQEGPLVVEAHFDFYDINEINDGAETFEFTGVLTLKWKDPRMAFDPAVEGVDEKIFQGAYQFNELATGWYPQVVLVNEAGMFDMDSVILRVEPDGTSILVQTLDAVAEMEFNMSRYPFDKHRLRAVFTVLGYDRDEVQMQVPAGGTGPSAGETRVPQWTVTGLSESVQERPAAYAGSLGVSSTFVVSVDVQRVPFFVMRLVVFPLVVIVFLSFTVFWMDRSSLGDRINVSFIGILTGVAYILVTSDQLPHISYVTLMHGFLNVSFMTMCATVVVNLVVGGFDKQGKYELGDRIDRACRWIFPLGYFALLFIIFGVAMIFY